MENLNKKQAQVREFVSPQLKNDEKIDAILSSGETGPSRWYALLTGYIVFFWVQMKAVVVTDQKVLLVKKNVWNGKPVEIEATYPHDAWRVISFNDKARIWGYLELGNNSESIKLRVHKKVFKEAAAVVAALGGQAVQ